MNTVFNKLGPYEVINEIGRGGMALVVLAKDTRTGRDVALKLVPIGITGEARDILEAEQLGAELQRQFSEISDHVPAVYEHLPNESGYFLVAMEYLDGENLSDVISRGAVPADRALTIALELCAFLEAAHNFAPIIDGQPRRSVVHGDLKPQNVRITSSGAVKVLDFGIAKALSLSRKVTRNDFGTRPYLSPERLDDDGDVNEFADLWAVGVMLYEMIRGARPFDAPDTQPLERIIPSGRVASGRRAPRRTRRTSGVWCSAPLSWVNQVNSCHRTSDSVSRSSVRGSTSHHSLKPAPSFISPSAPTCGYWIGSLWASRSG